MQKTNRRIVLSAALVVIAILADTSPAGAMGRPITGAETMKTTTFTSRAVKVRDREVRSTTALQSQVDALRKEVSDLRARLALMQHVASAR